MHASGNKILSREKLLALVTKLREQGILGWFVVDNQGNYEGPYTDRAAAEERLHTKDPYLMMSGGQIVNVSKLENKTKICPNCTSIQIIRRGETICTICKLPL